ncbi:MAG: trypsin-like peptidase domain-containing protein [bacterium]|jgi:S1-C subfamily serine protease
MRKTALLTIAFLLAFSAAAFAQFSDREFVAETVAKKVAPSLVSIEALNVVNTQLRFFGAARQQAISTVIGTGIILDTKGHILCKEYVVSDANLVRVTFNDGTQRDGEIIVKDKVYDLALLKVNPTGLKLRPIAVGNPATVAQGDSAICVGNSAGYTGTVTYGIVSAKRDYRTTSLALVPQMIQADCAINDGNQGAPIFNWKGEMIGFHSNVGAVRGDAANINFFLPSDLVMKFAREMIATGERPFKPYIGILPFARIDQVFGRWQEMGDDIRMYFDLPDEFWDVGVLIQEVDGLSPAFEFGLVKGDLIIKFEPTPGNEILIKSVGQLEKLILNCKEGQVVTFHVLRRNAIQKIALEVGNAPEERQISYIYYI